MGGPARQAWRACPCLCVEGHMQTWQGLPFLRLRKNKRYHAIVIRRKSSCVLTVPRVYFATSTGCCLSVLHPQQALLKRAARRRVHEACSFCFRCRYGSPSSWRVLPSPMQCRERVVGDVESQLMMPMLPGMHRARTTSRHGMQRASTRR